MNSIQVPSFDAATSCWRQQLALLLIAMVLCAGCKLHGRSPAAPSGDDYNDVGGRDRLQAGANAEPNQVCIGDAGSCPRAGAAAEPKRVCNDASTCEPTACITAADCTPRQCQQATCMNAQCNYAPLPAGSACGATSVCSQTGTCGECVPGTQRCLPGSATILETCSESSHWQRSQCEGQACFNAQCTGECEPSSTTCEAEKQRTCGVDGRYAAASACAAGSCSGGSCPNECQPNEARCLDFYRTQTCNETSTWSAITACDDQRCDLATGRCLTPCSPGTNRCANDKISQCESEGLWGAAFSCPYGCTARGCNECRPGTRECLDNQTERVCSQEGKWQTGTPCPLGCTGQACAVCREGDLRCTATALETCTPAGTWIEREACQAGCTQNQCNACEPNKAECPNPQDQRLIRVCNPDGTWKPTEGCRPNAHCVGGVGNTCPCNPGYRPRGQAGDPNAGDCIPM